MSSPQRPPRPIAPGDIVVAFSDHLGEWTAAQITSLEPETATAGVLELDWSGPEPSTVEDLGPELSPLSTTPSPPFRATNLVHCRLPWVLPRSHKVIGSAPLLHTGPVVSQGSMWRLGLDLGRRRYGVRWPDPSGWLNCTAANLASILDCVPDPMVRELTVTAVEELDCARLVTAFPALTYLSLHGNLGLLGNPAALRRLSRLRRLSLADLHGPTAEHTLRPAELPQLEWLSLDRMPSAYTESTRLAWQEEVRHGVDLRLTRPQDADWFTANRDNPLRDWADREQIDAETYRLGVAQFRATQEQILIELAGEGRRERLTEIGQDYGAAFQKLDADRDFLGYEETGELWEALSQVVDRVSDGVDLTGVKRALWQGMQAGLSG